MNPFSRGGRGFAAALILCSLALGTTACSDVEARPARDQVVGTWRVQEAFGREVLVLRADGTYAQHIVDSAGSSRESSGTWRYLVAGERGTRQPHISLLNALVYDPFKAEQPVAKETDRWQREDWVLWTVTDWGAPSLMWSPDENSFKKQ